MHTGSGGDAFEREVVILADGATLAGSWSVPPVPGATHLFEEPGALDRVAMLARDWFGQRLAQERIERAAS
ncbi:hypothetical protein [Sorangium sp. So ce426]|uniref:hypothetical protein n=1 Tax=Sorangium sp. So ce426 TaxID=3133312 RepID=UPI003F5AEE2D